MATADNNDAILSENGIFQLQNDKLFDVGLTCYICKKDTIITNVEEHIKNATHIGTLQRFGRTFERRDSKVCCKVCSKELAWSMVKDHAFWHTIPPWYEPVDRYKKFFANQMMEWETMFYCYPCDVIFPEWSTAFAHITEDSHRAIMATDEQTPNDSSSFTTVETLCELLVSEGFISGSSTELVCRICSRLGVRLTDIFTHIRGPLHTELKAKFVSTLNERYLNANIEKSQTKDSTDEKLSSNSGLNDSTVASKDSPANENLPHDDLSSDKSEEKSPSDALLVQDKLPCMYIIPENATDCYCKLCNVKLIGQTSIDYHFTSEWHASSLKKYGCDKISPKENNDYYCECCDWYIPDLENLHIHVMEQRHIQALSGKREMPTITELPVETMKLPDNAAHPSRRHLPSNYIEKFNNIDFCCRICNVLLSNLTLLDEHIAGQLHETTVKRYGLDSHITLIDGGKYHCGCCDYVIPNVEDICLHTMNVTHKLKSTVKPEALPSAAVTVTMEPTKQPAASRPTLTSYYMLQLNHTDLHCKICDIVLFGPVRLHNHLVGEQHASSVNRYGCYKIVLNEDGSYYCKVCKCKINNPEAMLYHVKGNMHTMRLAKEESIRFPVKVEPQSLLKNGSETTRHSLPDDLSRNLSNGDSSSEARHPPPSVQRTDKNPITAKPNAAVLNQYGCDSYILSIDGIKYHCKICKCEIPKAENIYGHITGTRHKSNVKDSVKNGPERPDTSSKTSPCRYIIKLSATDFHCQVCDQMLSGQTIDDHVAGDQHAASLKRYGCYNISLIEGIDYNCKSCRCRIPGLANVFLHIKGSMHRESLSGATHVPQRNDYSRSYKSSVKLETQRQLLQDSSQTARHEIRPDCSKKVDDSSSKTQTPVEPRINADPQTTALNEYTGCSYITPMDGNKYHCKCCDCVIPSFDNIYVHTSGNKHRSFVKDSTDQPTSFRHSPHCLYIVKLNDTRFQCTICDLALSDNATVEKHATGEQHAASLKRYDCSKISANAGNTYYCANCRCKIPSLANVYVHIKGTRHTNSIPAKTCLPTKLEEPRTNVNPVKAEAQSNLKNGTELAPQIAPLDYVLQLNSMDFYCKICNLSLTGRETVDDHLAAKPHANARLRYGCDHISPIEKGKYYCGLCSCEVPNLENVYRHVKGKRHIENVSSNNEILAKKPQTMKNADEATTSKVLDVNKAIPSPGFSLETLRQNLDPERTMNLITFLLDASAFVPQEINKSTVQVPCAVPGVSDVKRQSQSASNADGKSYTSDAEKSLIEKMRNCLEVEKVKQNRDKDSRAMPEVSSESADKSLRVDDFSENVSTNSLGIKFGSVESRDFNPANESSNSEGCDAANLASPASSQFTSRRTPNSGRKPRAPRKTNVQKVTEVFDFDNDYIHDMKDKLEEINLGMRLSLAVDAKTLYCLVCRSEVEVQSDDYTKHLSSVEHCENFETMKKDHALFEVVPGQFSDFDLALQYMEEMSDDRIQCFVCHEEIENMDSALQDHIGDEVHEQRCKKAQTEALEKYAEIVPRAQCDWYNIHKYRCEPCSANFQNEFSFAKHLNCTSHASFTKKSVNNERRLIYDFCSPCSVLWCGYPSTYARHCDSPTHKWIMHDGHCVSPDLPKSAQLLLATPQEYIEATIGYLDDVSAEERRREETLIYDVEREVKQLFPLNKVYTFGSRASGTSSPESDIDLFLDCGNVYYGNESSKDRTMAFITSVHLCLSKDTQYWETVQLSTNIPKNVPVIKAQHRATGLACNMSFDNGLGVENTKLIKLMIELFPECRKLILFLKQWRTFSGLTGSEGISSYAICWLVIFSLQKQSFLPSIATLIDPEWDSLPIAGWDVGVMRKPSHNPELRHRSIKELLIWFFAFYASFDYRYDVVCPLLGDAVKKRAFVDPQNLPKKMGAYVAHMRNSDDPEPFRIDSAMCVQDPFDLQRNLTKDVSKVCLSRFRIYCAKSRDLLCTF